MSRGDSSILLADYINLIRADQKSAFLCNNVFSFAMALCDGVSPLEDKFNEKISLFPIRVITNETKLENLESGYYIRFVVFKDKSGNDQFHLYGIEITDARKMIVHENIPEDIFKTNLHQDMIFSAQLKKHYDVDRKNIIFHRTRVRGGGITLHAEIVRQYFQDVALLSKNENVLTPRLANKILLERLCHALESAASSYEAHDEDVYFDTFKTLFSALIHKLQNRTTLLKDLLEESYPKAYALWQANRSLDSFLAIWDKRKKPKDFILESDHMIVNNTCCLLDENKSVILSLKMQTRNLMNQAHSMDQCSESATVPYANTPEIDLDESNDAYIERKFIQLNSILADLRKGKEVVFLQEIDVFEKKLTEKLVEFFRDILSERGFELILADKEDNTKPQAIIYQKSKLKLLGKRSFMTGVELGGNDPRNTCFEAKFEHIESGRTVYLSSVHLDYDADYSKALVAYSRKRAAEGALVIFAGDTNHTPGHRILGLVGDTQRATNYQVSIEHENTGKMKAYDGFGGCPPLRCSLRIIEEEGHQFATDNQGEFSIEKFTPASGHEVHISLPGFPWMRRQTIVLDHLGYREIFNLLLSGEISKNAQKEALLLELSRCDVVNDYQTLFNKLSIENKDVTEYLDFAQKLIGNPSLLALYACEDIGPLTISLAKKIENSCASLPQGLRLFTHSDSEDWKKHFMKLPEIVLPENTVLSKKLKSLIQEALKDERNRLNLMSPSDQPVI